MVTKGSVPKEKASKQKVSNKVYKTPCCLHLHLDPCSPGLWSRRRT